MGVKFLCIEYICIGDFLKVGGIRFVRSTADTSVL